MITYPITRVALVTGASSGIGEATAYALQSKGWRVYGVSRSGCVPEGVHALMADVSVAGSLDTAVRTLWRETQQLDLIVHAAGIGGAGSVENYPAEEARKIMDTNFMGALYLAQACLPHLRAQGRGKLLFVSSIAGLMGLPFHGIYSASKFAVEGLVESLRLELKGTGVQIVSICPGDTATSIIGNQYRARSEDLPLEYRANYQRANATMTQSVANGIPAEEVAGMIMRVAALKSPNVRYTVGGWLQRISPFIRRFLPTRWFERIMAKYYGLS